MNRIDLNCDMGESFGVYTKGRDREVLEHVSSANIACGFHAGDPHTMDETVRAAIENGVAIGAHPGLPDLAGFGRRKMQITPREAYTMVLYQAGALKAFVQAQGVELQHVKPHGALYHMASRDTALAQAVAEAVRDAGEDVFLYGLAGSELLRAGENAGVPTVSEVFADRTYQTDGSLTPRTENGAVITEREKALKQVKQMVTEGKVETVDGTLTEIRAESVCIHGDNEDAVDFARYIRKELEKDMKVKALGKKNGSDERER